MDFDQSKIVLISLDFLEIFIFFSQNLNVQRKFDYQVKLMLFLVIQMVKGYMNNYISLLQENPHYSRPINYY